MIEETIFSEEAPKNGMRQITHADYIIVHVVN